MDKWFLYGASLIAYNCISQVAAEWRSMSITNCLTFDIDVGVIHVWHSSMFVKENAYTLLNDFK